MGEAVQLELSLVPVIIILSVTAIKDIIEDYRRHLNDVDLNNKKCYVFNRDTKQYKPQAWKKIRVGDIILLRLNDVIPADLLLLKSSDKKGICFIETANIDGETNLKQRRVVPDVCQSEDENSEIHNSGQTA